MRPGIKKETRAQFTQSAPVFSQGPPVLSPSVMEPTSYYDEEMGSPKQPHFYNPDSQAKQNRRYSQTNDFELRLQFQNKKNETSSEKKGLFGFLGGNRKKNDPYPNYSYLNDVNQSRIDPMNDQIAAERNIQKKKKKSLFSCLFPFGKKEEESSNLLNIEQIKALQDQVNVPKQPYKVDNDRADSFKMFQQQNPNYTQNNNGMSSVQFPDDPNVQPSNQMLPKAYNPLQDPNVEFNSFKTQYQGNVPVPPKQTQPHQRTQMREENTRSIKPPEIGESVEFNSFRTYDNGTLRSEQSLPPPVAPRNKGPMNVVTSPGNFTRDVQFSFVGTSPLPEVPTLQNINPIKAKKPQAPDYQKTRTGDKSGSSMNQNSSAPDFDVLMSPRMKQQTLQKPALPRMSDNDMMSLLASPSTLKRKKKNLGSNAASEAMSSGKSYSESDMMDILMSPTTKRRNGASSFTSLDTEQANLLAPNNQHNGTASRRNL